MRATKWWGLPKAAKPPLVAEEVGFEPTRNVVSHGGLANRCLEPLGHSSIVGADVQTARSEPSSSARRFSACRLEHLQVLPDVAHEQNRIVFGKEGTLAGVCERHRKGEPVSVT